MRDLPSRHNDKNEIKDLIDIFIKEFHLDPGLQKIRVEETWAEQMGQGVQAYTEKVEFRRGVLLVFLKSAALREELSFAKEKIRKNLNEQLGGELIKEIKLM